MRVGLYLCVCVIRCKGGRCALTSSLCVLVCICVCVCVLFVAKVGGVHSPLACACWFVFVCVCVIRCKGGRCALTSSLCVLVCIVCVCVIRCKGGRCALTSSLCVLVCICVCVLFVAKVGGVHSPLACACWFVFVLCVCYSLQRWEVCTHL